MTLTTRSNLPNLTLSWQRLLPLLAWPWELLLLIFYFFRLYRQTMPPGISSWLIEGWDSAMFQVTGSTWGVPHSPGYPLYTILTNLFVRFLGIIPGLWGTEPAWRVSFWSTVTSLLTLIFLYLIIKKISRNRAAAIIATVLLGQSFIFWRGAIMAEVYSLNGLIFAATFWLAIVWDNDPRRRWLLGLGLLLGAGLVHHRTAFILPPTIALWVLVRRPKELICNLPYRPGQRWKEVIRRWLILGSAALLPLLSYLYLPWAGQRTGQTWVYADTSDWNTFWFVLVSREWWGLVQTPTTLATWLATLQPLFWQQAEQLTIIGLILGLVGLLSTRRYLWLFGPPILAFIYFGVSYKVADLDSMLIPLTLTVSIGIGHLLGITVRNLGSWLVRVIRVRDEALRGTWLSSTVVWGLNILILVGAYLAISPLIGETQEQVDLSQDWQAVDLIEEVVSIAKNGTPLTIIGQDNSVLPDFIYAKVVLGQPVDPLSTTTLARMPEVESITLLQDRLAQGHRVLIDRETLDLDFIPWIAQALTRGQLFQAPTGHPYLWELLPRPAPSTLPPAEPWSQLPPGQFLEGQVSIIAHQQHIIPKRTGCFLRLTLFWRAEEAEAVTEAYNVSVQPLGGETVLDKNDHLGLMRGFLSVADIQPGEIIRDEVDLLIRQPAALPTISLVVNLYQVHGNEFPTFGEVTLPVTVDPNECNNGK